ncbi:hypothetical protein FRX31_011113 [Thalictrum thalictroides]|uniref:Uncharacterized protein n=1 Tax=Thalictrum thalictroides TaxID=46969 RepID=A0A7J6WRT3_THATH|nr:hypothetical protein FRX31_011113 [Thalictrum thalictroides]
MQENPWAKELLNVPIEQYEELRLVCGDDQATGSLSRSMSDTQVEEGNEGSSAQNKSSEDRRRGKRTRPWDDVMAKVDGLSNQVGKLTEALVDDAFVEKLYSEVLGMDGFDMTFLEKAFDYLVAHQLEGKKFIVRRLEMRREWLQTFASTLD